MSVNFFFLNVGIKDADLGKRRREEARESFVEWQQHRDDALDALENLHIEYYSQTVKIYSGSLLCLQSSHVSRYGIATCVGVAEARKRMVADQKVFGKRAFELQGKDRLHRFEKLLRLDILFKSS